MKKSLFIAGLLFIEILLVIFGLNFIINTSYQNIIMGILMIILAVIISVFTISIYNKIIRSKNKVKESFSLIDVQLKLRFDLIPNLVTIVKKYASHEKEVLTEITKLRNLAEKTTNEKEKLDYANKMVPQMKNLIAIAEGYPELKSSMVFKSLMEQLSDVEDRIAASRRIYDSNVSRYNTLIEEFPNNIIAKIFGYKRETVFRIDIGENIMQKIDMGDK